jgi:protein transport protein SEC24
MFAHPPTHISQPPHTAGQPFKGLRTQIDPTQIPSPIEAIESDKEEWEDKSYTTLPGSHVPMASTDFLSIDQGNSSPKFIRMSTWNLPSSSKLASECSIPIAAVIQPFAEDDGDEQVPLVEPGLSGPARCVYCGCYINPWCTWTSGGNRWKCNLCSHETEVSSEYFCNLDANLLRLDHLQRPELNKGTVEFAVPDKYWASHPPPRLSKAYHCPDAPPPGVRNPEPLKYVFLLDVSHESVRSGFLQASCSAIKTALFGLEHVSSGLLPQSTVAIIGFDETLHFYDLSSNSDNPLMYVVPDLEEVFTPISTGLFAQPSESRP